MSKIFRYETIHAFVSVVLLGGILYSLIDTSEIESSVSVGMIEREFRMIGGEW